MVEYWQFYLAQSNDRWQSQKSVRPCLAPRRVTWKLSLSILMPSPHPTPPHTHTRTHTHIHTHLSLSLSQTHTHTPLGPVSLHMKEFLIKHSSVQSFYLPTSANLCSPWPPSLTGSKKEVCPHNHQKPVLCPSLQILKNEGREATRTAN